MRVDQIDMAVRVVANSDNTIILKQTNNSEPESNKDFLIRAIRAVIPVLIELRMNSGAWRFILRMGVTAIIDALEKYIESQR